MAESATLRSVDFRKMESEINKSYGSIREDIRTKAFDAFIGEIAEMCIDAAVRERGAEIGSMNAVFLSDEVVQLLIGRKVSVLIATDEAATRQNILDLLSGEKKKKRR